MRLCFFKHSYFVLELCLVRIETFSYLNITDKDTMFDATCKAKIIVLAKGPLLQILCCPHSLGNGAVIALVVTFCSQLKHSFRFCR